MTFAEEKQYGRTARLVSWEEASFEGEYYKKEKCSIHNLTDITTKRIVCKENAEVLSIYLPDQAPAVYMYTNKAGRRFLVLTYDHYDRYAYEENPDYLNNYYRQTQLIEAIERLGCGAFYPGG